MSSILTILYAVFMTHWALALCITLQKLLPFRGWRCFGSATPRLLLMLLLTMVVAATIRHLTSWETKPEELMLAFVANALFWWVLWFHRHKFKTLDTYF